MSERNIDTKHNQKEEITFDPDVLAEKYLQERDKRLRDDGNDQYLEVKGDFSYFVEDPFIDEEIERSPLEDEVEVVIVGGGFGGMVAAARLKEAGIGVQVHYIPVYFQPYYRQLGYKERLCPNSETFYKETLSIPIYPDMSTEDIDYVIETVLEVFSNF